MRSLFPKGRPKAGTPSDFSPIMEGSASPLSPHSSSFVAIGRSREDLLMGSMGSLGLTRSRENISKSRESLSKSIRGSREDVAQSSLTEPPSSNLSKYTFLNVVTSRNLETIKEPSELSRSTNDDSAEVQEPEIKLKENIILDLEIPPNEPITSLSSNSSLSSSGNFLLTYATPPFMETTPVDSSGFQSVTSSRDSKRCNVWGLSPRGKLTEISDEEMNSKPTANEKLNNENSLQFSRAPILKSNFSPQPSKSTLNLRRESVIGDFTSGNAHQETPGKSTSVIGPKLTRSAESEKYAKNSNEKFSSSLPR